MQSQASTTSKLLIASSPVRLVVTSSCSQSKVVNRKLVCGRPAGCFPLRFCEVEFVVFGYVWVTFSLMFLSTSLATYCWSVRTYLWTVGATARPTSPDIPHPSSSTLEDDVNTPDDRRRVSELARYSATSGVIFQTTSRSLAGWPRSDDIRISYRLQ